MATQPYRRELLFVVGLSIVIGGALLAGATPASATSIGLDSATGIPFTSTGTSADCAASGLTVLDSPESAWATAFPASTWISCAQTGNGGISLPNGAIVTINEAFTVPTGDVGTGGTVDVLADDTAAVYINGTELFAPDLTPGSTCAAMPIGCTSQNTGVVTLPAGLTGANVFTVVFYQTNGDGSGADWAGSYNIVPTPEPATLALFSPSMLSLMWLLRRRKSVAVA